MSKRNRHVAQRSTKQLLPTALVDVIILVHGRFDLLEQCLNALPEAFEDISYKVYIFDNASPNKVEADKFYETHKNATIARSKENLGFPRACNLAFIRGTSPLVFFLNSDVILRPGSMIHLVSAMDDPKTGVAGMKLLFPEHTDLPQNEVERPAGKVQHVGLSTNIRADIFHQFLGWSEDHPKVNAMRDVYAVTGAAMMTRRRLFQEAGKFNEIYGQGTFEDVDYCLTLRKMGYNTVVEVKAIGIHHTGATAVTYQIGYPLNENRVLFLQKWQKFLDWTEWVSW